MSRRHAIRLVCCCLFLTSMPAGARLAGTSEPIACPGLTRLQQAGYADSLALLDMWDALHAASTLQGIVNRHEPRLYIDYVGLDGRRYAQSR